MGMKEEAMRNRGIEVALGVSERVAQALVVITNQKSRLVTLKAAVDTSVAATDGIYSAADQSALLAMMGALKSDVQTFAAAL